MTETPAGLRPFGFHGPVDYIERITYRIWNRPQRDIESISRFYSPTTTIHVDGADLIGDEVVIANTRARVKTYPDFHGIIDDTIWIGSEDEGYRTSMRWTWTGTDTGGSPFGAATGRPVRFVAIANCVLHGQVITEEWLGANPLSQARQLGYSTADAVAATAPPTLPTVPRPPGPPGPPGRTTLTAAGETVAAILRQLLNGGSATGFTADCHTTFAGDRIGTGPGAVENWAGGLRDALGVVTLHIDDQYEVTHERKTRLATQARLQGTGPNGPLEILLIAHHHVVNGSVVAQWLTYDELALAHRGVLLSPPTE